MERKDLPEVLFEKMNEIVDYYPIQVKSVEGMLDQTGFFPGCRGLWQQVPSDEFPSILVLGHDFGNIKYYDDLVAGRQVDMAGNTFKNLITLFDEAGIKLSKCFFSNVIMGLRDTTDMTGKNPGNSDKLFMGKNLEFLAYQIETIKPKLIITMGQYATKMLGSLSIKDLKAWSDFKQWGDISKDGNSLIKENVNINNHICSCVAIEHTSVNRLNVIGKKYNRVKIYENYDAEVRMLEDVLASIPRQTITESIVNTSKTHPKSNTTIKSTTNTKKNSNAIAVDLVKQEFIKQGFKVEPSKVKSSIANFNIVLDSGRTIQIKVRVITRMGDYIFSKC